MNRVRAHSTISLLFFFFFWLSNVRAIPRHLTISAFGERCVHVRECSLEGLIAIVIFGYVITVVACIKWRNKKQKKTKYVLTSRRTFILFHSSRANANFVLTRSHISILAILLLQNWVTRWNTHMWCWPLSAWHSSGRQQPLNESLSSSTKTFPL